MKISQLSKATGVSARSIRYYEKKNLLAARRLDNDYREFDEADIKRINTIQIYLELGMSTNEILEILKCHDEYDSYTDSDGFCEEMLEAYEEKRKEIIQQIQTLTSVQHRLDQRIEQMRVRQSLNRTVSGSTRPTSKSTF
ncbi:DNA-binding transcriptional regulator, MerR family [Paenibacillus catalpae]|uniref:DNA-binding transcriptional regulator, MerR family n=1 Tax=Paenibacillus catalpae TaxID=1045775 RepID=A0A1I1Y7U7_9BACL|nr:MerR family transcriptional regulator [Paenibacillus catalpae]SFE13940.1 DNA-binding transcriptional regulator, MerR family [Paenibacillus catalpae]